MSSKLSIVGSVTPMVVDEKKISGAQIDIFSRLLADRIIFLGEEIDDEIANTIVAELLFLDSASKTHEPIHMYINTPGGYVDGGLAIYDTMRMIKSPVYTTCVGHASSMGAVLMAAGEKGNRSMLKHARVMIHQPSAGYRGTQADIEISANLLKKYKDELYDILSEHIGKPAEEIKKDSERDFWLTAEEAVQYGIADKII